VSHMFWVRMVNRIGMVSFKGHHIWKKSFMVGWVGVMVEGGWVNNVVHMSGVRVDTVMYGVVVRMSRVSM